MALFLEATFVSEDGKKVLGVCQATGAPGKQVPFKLSAMPDLPAEARAILRLGPSLQASVPRIIEEKDAAAEKVWVKAGKNDDDLIVQLLFKKQVTAVVSLWKLSKCVVTCPESTAPQHFIASQRVTCTDEEGAEELLDCARAGEPEGISGMLERPGVHVDYQNETGTSALHYAAANGHEDCVSLLLQKGARMMPNSSGNTPLHWAVLNKSAACVKALLTAPGTDVLAKNGFGRSALTEAFAAEQTDVTLMLLEHSSASALDSGEGAEEEEVDDQGDEEGGGDAEMEVDEAGGDAMRE